LFQSCFSFISVSFHMCEPLNTQSSLLIWLVNGPRDEKSYQLENRFMR